MLDASTTLEDQLMWLEEMGSNAELLYGAEELKKEAEAAAALLAAEEERQAKLEKERKQKEEAAAARKLKEQTASLGSIEERVAANASRAAAIEEQLENIWYPLLDASADGTLSATEQPAFDALMEELYGLYDQLDADGAAMQMINEQKAAVESAKKEEEKNDQRC